MRVSPRLLRSPCPPRQGWQCWLTVQTDQDSRWHKGHRGDKEDGNGAKEEGNAAADGEAGIVYQRGAVSL